MLQVRFVPPPMPAQPLQEPAALACVSCSRCSQKQNSPCATRGVFTASCQRRSVLPDPLRATRGHTCFHTIADAHFHLQIPLIAKCLLFAQAGVCSHTCDLVSLQAGSSSSCPSVLWLAQGQARFTSFLFTCRLVDVMAMVAPSACLAEPSSPGLVLCICYLCQEPVSHCICLCEFASATTHRMAIPFNTAIKSLGFRWLLGRDHGVRDDDVDAAIRTMVISSSALPMLIFSAIMLADPAHGESLHCHVGSHPNIMCEMCDAMIDRHFGAHMARAVCELMTRCLDTQRIRYAFEITFWCNLAGTGRWRPPSSGG